MTIDEFVEALRTKVLSSGVKFRLNSRRLLRTEGFGVPQCPVEYLGGNGMKGAFHVGLTILKLSDDDVTRIVNAADTELLFETEVSKEDFLPLRGRLLEACQVTT